MQITNSEELELISDKFIGFYDLFLDKFGFISERLFTICMPLISTTNEMKIQKLF